MTAIKVELEPRRALVADQAREHECAVCDRPARLWVDVGLPYPEPCCRRCADRVKSSDTVKQALVDLAREAPADPPPQHVVSPPLKVTPERRLTLVEAARRAGAMRRRCLACSMVTSPPNLALHQRAAGHTGYEEVSR